MRTGPVALKLNPPPGIKTLGISLLMLLQVVGSQPPWRTSSWEAVQEQQQQQPPRPWTC